MSATIKEFLLEQINVANNLVLTSIQKKDYQAAYEYSIRLESYERLINILTPAVEAESLLHVPVSFRNPYKSNNTFKLTATFCYCCPHVQITNMGFDAVHAQTKEDNYFPISTSGGFVGEPISENELSEMILYSQGNTVTSPRDEDCSQSGRGVSFPNVKDCKLISEQELEKAIGVKFRLRGYGSAGDSELDMRKIEENENEK